MFKIVACPTAGSCGIVPAAAMVAAEEMQTPCPVLVDALFTQRYRRRRFRNPVAGAVGGARPNVDGCGYGGAAVAEMAGG